METFEARIRQQFFRKTKAHPEGEVAHDGDCDTFSVKVCTCGLLHRLMVDPVHAEELYPDFMSEMAAYERVREDLMHHKPVRKH